MQYTLLASFALALCTAAYASPVSSKRADAPTDTQLLQFALALEHLENDFYSTHLKQFDAKAFTDAGFPAYIRDRVTQIGQHEAAHVKFLSTALGNDAVEPCSYQFPVTDVHSFLALAQVLEGVGVSAYLGAARFIDNPSYLTAAGSILTTESRHNAWLGSVANKGAPWSGSMDTPLDLNEVYSLAAPFIRSCPSSNPPLYAKTFPPLSATKKPVAGQSVTLKYDGADSGLFLVLASGLSTSFIPITSKKATLPSHLQGTVYAVVSKNGHEFSDADTVAGPVIFNFPLPSTAVNYA